MLMVNGPLLWHSGHEPGLTSVVCDCVKGPITYEHLLQSYLTIDNCGKIPVVDVTTPDVLINWFKCSCLLESRNICLWIHQKLFKKQTILK